MEVLLCLGACEVVPPAAWALLSTLAKLFAMAHAPGSALCAELQVRCIGGRRPTAARCVRAKDPVCVKLMVPDMEEPGRVQDTLLVRADGTKD